MIDNNPMDYNAVVSELREMREQKERLYYRDEALNRPDEIVKAAKKQNTPAASISYDSDLSTFQLNQIASEISKQQSKHSNPHENGMGCVGVCMILFIGYLVSCFVYSILT